jgi:putative transposase
MGKYQNQGSVVDFQIGRTMDARPIKFLNVFNEYSRVVLSLRVGWRCRASGEIDTNEERLNCYPAPIYLWINNEPWFTTNAL